MTMWKNTSDIRIKKRDGVYWARFQKRGRRVEASLETKNFEIARQLVAEIESKMLLGRSWKRERQLFRDAWIEFLVDKKSGNKVRPAREKTLFEYSAFGTRFYLPYFGDLRLADIDSNSWLGFVTYVKKHHGEIQFFNIRKYMQGFLTWAKRHEKILVPPYLFDPDAKKTLEKEEFTPGKAYTKDELKRLRDSAMCHERFYLFMLMAQFMGMRPSEMTQLKRERIDFKDRIIILKKVDTKTNTGRRVPIHPRVMPHLRLQYDATEGLDYLFPNRSDKSQPMDRAGFRKVWKKIEGDAGIKGRLYDFRHTFITHAIADGMNPAIVAEITGTSLRIIQKHYLHLAPNDLADAINRFEL